MSRHRRRPLQPPPTPKHTQLNFSCSSPPGVCAITKGGHRPAKRPRPVVEPVARWVALRSRLDTRPAACPVAVLRGLAPFLPPKSSWPETFAIHDATVPSDLVLGGFHPPRFSVIHFHLKIPRLLADPPSWNLARALRGRARRSNSRTASTSSRRRRMAGLGPPRHHRRGRPSTATTCHRAT